MRSITDLAQRDGLFGSGGGGGGLSLGGVHYPSYTPGTGFSGSGTQSDPYTMDDIVVKPKSAASATGAAGNNILSSLFSNFGQIGTGVGSIIGALKGQPVGTVPYNNAGGAEQQPRGISPWVWIGGGVAVILLVLTFFKRKGG